MNLEFEQSIGSENANILRNIYSKRKFLAHLKDYRLFCKDFRNFLRNNSKVHYDYFREKPILRGIGSYIFPQNSIDRNRELSYYLQESTAEKINNLMIGFGGNQWVDGFTFFLKGPNKKGTVFSLSQIYNDWMDEDDENEEILAEGLILDFATFFYNLQPLQEKIEEILLSSENYLVEHIGKNLFNDFVLLFSTNQESKNIPIIDFSKISIEKTFLEEDDSEIKEGWIQLGSCDHYYKNEKNPKESWGRSLNRVDLWLSDSDKLVTIVVPEEMQSFGYPYLVNFKSKVFDNFVKHDVNDWVNRIISSTIFADNIYQNFKSRLIIDNI
jgi:hypothetical protein